jgi:hypothetical protein
MRYLWVWCPPKNARYVVSILHRLVNYKECWAATRPPCQVQLFQRGRDLRQHAHWCPNVVEIHSTLFGVLWSTLIAVVSQHQLGFQLGFIFHFNTVTWFHMENLIPHRLRCLFNISGCYIQNRSGHFIQTLFRSTVIPYWIRVRAFYSLLSEILYSNVGGLNLAWIEVLSLNQMMNRAGPWKGRDGDLSPMNSRKPVKNFSVWLAVAGYRFRVQLTWQTVWLGMDFCMVLSKVLQALGQTASTQPMPKGTCIDGFVICLISNCRHIQFGWTCRILSSYKSNKFSSCKSDHFKWFAQTSHSIVLCMLMLFFGIRHIFQWHLKTKPWTAGRWIYSKALPCQMFATAWDIALPLRTSFCL